MTAWTDATGARVQAHSEHPGHFVLDVRAADVVTGNGARAGRGAGQATRRVKTTFWRED